MKRSSKGDLFGANMRVLRRHHPELARRIEENPPPAYDYQVEPARNGSPTLSLLSGGKTIQIHSRYDPEKEATQQLDGAKLRNPKLLLILGLGLGYHLRACLSRLERETHFIVVMERDLQALRLAMESLDLNDVLTSKKVLFAVGIDPAESFAFFAELIRQAGISLQLFLKTAVAFEHPVLATLNSEYHRMAMRSFRQAAEMTIVNYGNCPRDSMTGVRNIMGNLGTIIRNPGIKEVFGAFRGVPGILVSTGPSLDGNISALPAASGKCIMICADSALRALYKKGIRPDAVASLERIIGVVKLFEDIPPEEMKNIWLAGTPVIMPEVYEVWKGPTAIVYRDFAHFDWLGIPKGTLEVGASCSNMAFKILEALGCDPIILVGQDCSFPSTEKTHADEAHTQTRLNLSPENLYRIRGNTQEWVFTNHIFDLFRKHFVKDVGTFKGTCINSTEGGALIEGTTVMPLAEAIGRFCTATVDVSGTLGRLLKPTPDQEIRRIWKEFRENILVTQREVKDVIALCEAADKVVADFENQIAAARFTSLQDFLERFPTESLEQAMKELQRLKGKVLRSGRAFEKYLLHIVQMVFVQYEMDLNELPSLYEDPRQWKTQAVRKMKEWFGKTGDICRLSLGLLEDSRDRLEKEFGP